MSRGRVAGDTCGLRGCPGMLVEDPVAMFKGSLMCSLCAPPEHPRPTPPLGSCRYCKGLGWTIWIVGLDESVVNKCKPCGGSGMESKP